MSTSEVASATNSAAGPPKNVVTGIIKAIRPKQWVKNLLVLAAPIAALGAEVPYDYDEMAINILIAFVSFSMAASCIYLVNDSRDVEADRQHPTKRFRPIAAGVDDLAQALARAQADRARLQRRVVTRGDEERKAVARDLHDEMGPCLFGLRVEADALREAAPTPAIAAHAQAIARIAEEIARVNRALLGDLRPAAIGQLPLAAVLADYVADLGRRFPDLEIGLDLAPGLPEPDEATALTLFRILQEGTTNALRHAGASRVSVRLWTDLAHWRMELRDNGRGMAPGAREGTGLTGMRERITLLGGDLRLFSGAGGTTIAASLPLPQTEEGST